MFEPLEAMLAARGGSEGEYFLGQDTPSSVDCLALGYLSLALVPELASPWLRDAMLAKAPTVARCIQRMRASCFGDAPIEPAQALNPSDQSRPLHDLPWHAPERPSVPKIGSTLLATLADATPVWRDFRTNARIGQMAQARDSGLSEEDTAALSAYAKTSRSDMYLSIGAVGAGVVALVGYMAQVGLFSAAREESRLDGGAEGEYVLDAEQTAADLSAL